MNPNTKYLLKMLIIGLWLMLLARLSYGQYYVYPDRAGVYVKVPCTYERKDHYENKIDSLGDYDCEKLVKISELDSDYLIDYSYGQSIRYHTPDSIEVNQIGFVVWQRYPIYVSEKDSIVTWDFILKKDTLWFDENKPIALPGNYEKQLSRKIWKKK